ncbi:MAG TPA: lamin tail domain-containing protein, partial [Longimicrobium sp.]
MKLRSALSLTLVTATALLGACRDDGLVAPGVVTEPAPKVLGLVEITLTGIGTPGMKATVTPLRGGSASAAGGPSYALSAVPGGGIQVGSRTASTLDSRGQRYLQAVFAVRNASTDGTANTTARSNVTFIPVSTASTIAGTPFSRFLKQDGSAADPAIATQLVPTGAVASDGAGGVAPQYADVMQAFSEAELAAVTTPDGVTNKFAYGYVVRRVDSDGSLNATTRELPANPAPGQFDGAVTFAYRFPIQATSGDNPFTISIVALAVDDSETRVTQSLEEQTAAGRAAFEARVASLNAAGITLLPGGTSNSTLPKRMLCSVRTAGDAGAPTRTLTGLTVVINEIMANPAKVDDTLGEYFEVYNPCSEPVNLRNWRILSAGTTAEANTGHVIASDVIVPAGGYSVLTNNDASGTNGGFTANYKYAGINLNNSTTDWLAIRTPAGASIDSVSWAAAAGETASSPPNGASRALIDPLRDNLFMSGASSSWVASSTSTPYGAGDFGTPGSANGVTGVTGPPSTINVGPDFVTT